MGEQIDNLSMDKLFNPNLRGAEAQAKLDFENYLSTRPVEKLNERDLQWQVYDSSSNEIDNVDAFFDDKREQHYNETNQAQDNSLRAISTLARQIAKAEHDGDKTKVEDLSDILLEKMAAAEAEFISERDHEGNTERSDNYWNRVMKIADQKHKELSNSDALMSFYSSQSSIKAEAESKKASSSKKSDEPENDGSADSSNSKDDEIKEFLDSLDDQQSEEVTDSASEQAQTPKIKPWNPPESVKTDSSKEEKVEADKGKYKSAIEGYEALLGDVNDQYNDDLDKVTSEIFDELKNNYEFSEAKSTELIAQLRKATIGKLFFEQKELIRTGLEFQQTSHTATKAYDLAAKKFEDGDYAEAFAELHEADIEDETRNYLCTMMDFYVSDQLDNMIKDEAFAESIDKLDPSRIKAISSFINEYTSNIESKRAMQARLDASIFYVLFSSGAIADVDKTLDFIESSASSLSGQNVLSLAALLQGGKTASERKSFVEEEPVSKNQILTGENGEKYIVFNRQITGYDSKGNPRWRVTYGEDEAMPDFREGKDYVLRGLSGNSDEVSIAKITQIEAIADDLDEESEATDNQEEQAEADDGDNEKEASAEKHHLKGVFKRAKESLSAAKENTAMRAGALAVGAKKTFKEIYRKHPRIIRATGAIALTGAIILGGVELSNNEDSSPGAEQQTTTTIAPTTTKNSGENKRPSVTAKKTEPRKIITPDGQTAYLYSFDD